MSPLTSRAGVVVIDFETFPDATAITDSTPITTQFPGLTFTNTTVISAGITLNEFEFPPHSWSNVGFDDGGPISITFASSILSFGAYFTYTVPLTLSAFDGANNLVARATPAFSNNLALSGDSGSSPNEFLSLSFPSGIVRVSITGDPAGSSFVFDDLTVETSDTGVVPEPTSLTLVLISMAASFAMRKKIL